MKDLTLQRIPKIRYEDHPAYKGMSVPAVFDDQYLTNVIESIDADLKNIKSKYYRYSNLLKRDFAHFVLTKFSLIYSHIAEKAQEKPLRDLVIGCLNRLKNDLFYEAVYWNARAAYKASSRQGSAKKILHDLEEAGMSRLQLSKKMTDELLDACRPFRGKVVAKAKEDPYGRADFSIPSFEKTWDIVNLFLKENLVIEAISDYKRARMEVLYCAMEYSHERQTWWKGCYADVGLAESKTAYMHVDHDCDMAKMLIYLTPVKNDTGPTGYVRGSNKWDRSNFLFMLHKALDAEAYERYFDASRDCYYRPMYKNRNYRKIFLSLPEPFRGTSHFGDDVLDGTQISQYLLDNEVTILGEPGTSLLFDGSRGIHRGAMVKHGERVVLQIGFRDASRVSYVSHIKRKIINAVRRVKISIS